MFERISFFLELRRYPNFHHWMRATTSKETLKRLVNESTDCDLIRPWNPFSDTFERQGMTLEDKARMIYKRFGPEIWGLCLAEGGYENNPHGMESLARLPLASQVIDPKIFLEFMVRNAIRRAARQILEKT